MSNTKKNKTSLNKRYRFPASINSRNYKGEPLIYSMYFEERTGRKIVRKMDQSTENGGIITPFNYQPLAAGACAIRNIIVEGDNTSVIFADGDRVCLQRHPEDNDDPVTAVLWALGTKAFGTGLVRQIRSAIKYRTVDVERIRSQKAESKKDKNAEESAVVAEIK